MSHHLRSRLLVPLVALAVLLIFLAPQALSRPAPPAVQVFAGPTTAHLTTASYQLYHPFFFKDYFGLSSTLYVQNLSSSQASFTLVFPDGRQPVSDVLQPGGGRAIAASSLTQLPGSTRIAVLLLADQPMQSLVVNRKTTGSDRVTDCPGLPPPSAATSLLLGPSTVPTPGMSSVTVENTGSGSANLIFEAVDATGAIRATYHTTVNPGAVVTVASSAISGLTPDFNGYVRVRSDQPTVGFASFEQDTLSWIRPAMAPSTKSFVPRLLSSAADAGGSRTTRLTLVSTAAAVTNVSIEVFHSNGTGAGMHSLTVPPRGMVTFDPSVIPALAPGFAGSAVVSSDWPLGVVELTSYDGAATRASNADSYLVPGVNLSSIRADLPFLAFGAGERTVVSAQNAGTDNAQIALMLANGVIGTASGVMPGASTRFDTSTTGWGPFSGSGAVTLPVGSISVLVDIEGEPLPLPPIATEVPTPTRDASPGQPALLYLNFTAGAPGSAFVVRGYHFPAGGDIELWVNSALAITVSADAEGSFGLVLRAPPGARPGYYVLVAKAAGTGAALAQGGQLSALDIANVRLVTSGPDAVVRAAPPGAPTTTADVPAASAANPFDSLPINYLPYVRR